VVRVKVCGITNLGDAQAAIDAGSDALGFVFYKKSPRYIKPQNAKEIIKRLPKEVIKVGVFVNALAQKIKQIAKLCHLDMLQFHGSEPSEFCADFKNYKVIKAFRIKDRIEVQNILKYNTFAYLFDTFLKSKVGGTGKKFNWELVRNIGSIKRPVFLSGGLTSRNVKRAIKIAKPAWVDVSSSVEIKPGKKDPAKIKRFIEAVKQ
jgi:phosphoribosylanthranilate isomerase